MELRLKKAPVIRLLISLSCLGLILYIWLLRQDHSLTIPELDFPSTPIGEEEDGPTTMNKIKALATSQTFASTWPQMETEDLKTWTARIREYSTLFRMWDSLVDREMDGDRTELDQSDDVLDEISMHELNLLISPLNRRMFPWIRHFQSSPLAMRNSYIGRGVVMAVGNYHAPMAIANVKYLRALGSRLPIEVVYNGHGDLEERFKSVFLQVDNLRLVNLQEFVVDDIVKVSGWAIKPFSLFISSFEEALLMDADVVFVQNPDSLFDDVNYRKWGTIFYKDRTLYTDPRTNPFLKSIIPEPWSQSLQSTRWWQTTSAHEMESGVVIFNKRKRFLALLAVAMINVSQLRDKIYEVSHGDKESYWIAAEMAGEPYYWTKYPSGAIGPNYEGGDDDPNDICSVQLFHVDEQGQPLWFNQWIFKNRFEPQQGYEKFERWAIEPGNSVLG
eukprot:Partr_v1_DN28725_c1_g2_i1_m62432 putative Strain CBS138 chromosome C complete sequence